MINLDHAAEAAVASNIEPLTELGAARRLGLKVATLRAWRRQQRGPAYVRLGRAVRYLTHDVDDFLRANRHGPRSVM